MATQLLWKAYQLNQNIYDKLLYCHPLSVEVSTEHFQLQGDTKKLIPFYIGSFMILLLCAINCYALYLYIFSTNKISLGVALYCLQVALFCAVALFCNIITVLQGKSLFGDCLNMLHQFDRRIREDTRGVGYAVNVSRRQLIAEELKKLIRDKKSADVMGLIMHCVVASLCITGYTISLFGIFSNFDSIHLAFGDDFLPSFGIFGFFIRFLVMEWSCIEMCRSLLLFLLPAVSIFNVYTSCLRIIGNLPPDEDGLKLYTELRCIHQCGVDPIRHIAGMLIGVGFLLGVVGSWIIFAGWRTLSHGIYVMMSCTSFLVLLVTGQTLPKIVNCQECSKHMISTKWPKMAVEYWRSSVNHRMRTALLAYKIWKRKLFAQRYVAFYYGSAVFDEETKTNFYYNVFDYTVNILMIT